jgi:hypothetical protein
LSGLIVDIFGEVAVIASSAAWVEKYRPQIESLVSQVSGVKHTWWRSSVDILKEEGLNVSHQKEQSQLSVAHAHKVKVSKSKAVYVQFTRMHTLHLLFFSLEQVVYYCSLLLLLLSLFSSLQVQERGSIYFSSHLWTLFFC